MAPFRHRLAARLRYSLRWLYYGTPAWRLGSVGRKNTPAHETVEYWDSSLSGRLAPYLGDTPSIAIRNAVVSSLLKLSAPRLQSVLDIGCGNASLATCLPPRTRYVGIDISRNAIESAGKRLTALGPESRSDVSLHVSSLTDYALPDQPCYDGIVFSEVLYYLAIDSALLQFERYAQALRPGGAILVSMKRDPKSKLIFRHLARCSTWRGGVLYQSTDRITYSTRYSAEAAAFLVGAFVP